jgi:phosphonate transport system substrate-binding protein
MTNYRHFDDDMSSSTGRSNNFTQARIHVEPKTEPPGGRIWALVATGLLAIVGLTVLFYSIVMDIEREYGAEPGLDTGDTLSSAKTVVYVGVISRYPPTTLFRGYQPIMDYLTENTPYRFELLLSSDYNEALQNLISRRVSAVFLGSYLYVQAHERYGVIPVLKPLNENMQPVSRSVLIAGSTTAIRTVKDLAGKKLALPSPESFSAHWIIEYECARNGIAVRDFATVHNFSHHHTVIAQVLSGTYDAGVTREYLVKDLLGKELTAVLYSDAIPTSPLAVLKDYDRGIIEAMKAALLAVNRDATRRPALTREWDGEFVNGFVEASDADYAPIRAITNAVSRGSARR